MMSETRTNAFRNAVVARSLALAAIGMMASSLWGQERWAFEPEPDSFEAESLIDLRYLNEEVAGQSGWVKATDSGDFALGSGEPVRFWATNTGVGRDDPYVPRPKPGWQTAPDLSRHARWLAKRGVNLIRLHTHINPDPATQALDEVNQDEVDWIWRTVAAMKEEGVYTVVSPYWANTMESDDAKWGTDWEGKHHGLLFFDETLQAAYKEWLRALFTTPNDYLDGGTLADEPALAIFQFQNEDSLLFWTVENLSESSRHKLEGRFYHWAVGEYGSIDEALAAWGSGYSDNDDLANERLGLTHIWNLTGDGMDAVGEHPRLDDQLQFYVETMMDFNREISRFVREDLGCPVLLNAGNWKTADVVYLEDSERYSYSSTTDVVALNRYFAGVHEGPYKGWGVVGGDVFTSPSVLKDSATSLPVSVKQPVGKPTMVTESTWVTPMDSAFEAPMLISAYSSLSGFDGYFWFAAETEGFVPPRSANGYNDSQEMWICLTPDMGGQWPAAALAFRKGYVQHGQPVVQEHRSLEAMWQRKSPIIAESPSFDPNRDEGDLPPDSSLPNGIDPLAFLAGPVTVQYDSSESNSAAAHNLDTLIEEKEGGARVTSVTGELTLDTSEQRFTVDSPYVKTLITYKPAAVDLGAARFESPEGELAVTAISLDGRPVASSMKILVQMASPTRPAGWQQEPTQIELSDGNEVPGFHLLDFGGPPWMLETRALKVRLSNPLLANAYALDANGMPIEELPLTIEAGQAAFDFPEGALYVVLVGEPLRYADWRASRSWPDDAADGGPSEDPDGDGIQNLLEFAAAGDPLKPDPKVAVAAVGIAGEAGAPQLQVQFRRNLAAEGIVDGFDISSDLVKWTALAAAQTEAWEVVLPPDAAEDGTGEWRTMSVPLDTVDLPVFLRRRTANEEHE